VVDGEHGIGWIVGETVFTLPPFIDILFRGDAADNAIGAI
jgi:hypothetical protein